MRIPTGREWRRRWARLEDRERAHITSTVRTGGALREPEWAALAVTYARSRLRDTHAANILAPGLLIVALILGTALGRAGRGEVVTDVTWRLLSLGGGLPWVGLWTAETLLLHAATRRWRRRLREAEEVNLRRLGR